MFISSHGTFHSYPFQQVSGDCVSDTKDFTLRLSFFLYQEQGPIEVYGYLLHWHSRRKLQIQEIMHLGL